MSALKGKKLFPFVAPPSGGKGTQTAALLNAYPQALDKFDMGATFRQVTQDPDHPLGQRIREAMEAGRLVDIDIVVQIFEEGLKKAVETNPNAKGIILDGFPRNMDQLNKLIELVEREGASIANAFYLNVPDRAVIDRSAGRVFHKKTDAVFNLRIPGLQPPGYDPDTFVLEKSDYYQRDDDKEEVVRKRLVSFQKDTEPMIRKFRDMGILQDVNGDRAPKAITEDLLAAMKHSLKEEPSLSGLITLLVWAAFMVFVGRLMKGLCA